jgi:hypothetical protein
MRQNGGARDGPWRERVRLCAERAADGCVSDHRSGAEDQGDFLLKLLQRAQPGT